MDYKPGDIIPPDHDDELLEGKKQFGALPPSKQRELFDISHDLMYSGLSWHVDFPNVICEGMGYSGELYDYLVFLFSPKIEEPDPEFDRFFFGIEFPDGSRDVAFLEGVETLPAAQKQIPNAKCRLLNDAQRMAWLNGEPK